MRAIRSVRWRLAAVFATLLLASGSGRAAETRLAIGGYDPVAYFTDGKPAAGHGNIEYTWHNARWRFASVAHRDAFASDPERFAPQYDGYCAMGVALGKEAHKDIVDPKAWAIVDGKLYLTHNTEALAKWQKDPAENIKKADSDWPSVEKQTVIYDGYPDIKK